MMEDNEEEIEENIRNKKLPCGCEPGNCSCKISAIEYVLKYQKFIGKSVKQSKLDKTKVLKAAGKKLKEGYQFLKK